jgi:uncharacterized protein involved in exopolysaccharide biosynthesis
MSDQATSRREVQDAPSPTLRDLLTVMFRQKRVALYTFLVVLAISLTYALLATSYEAHMKVLVRRGRLDPMVTPEQNSPVEFARPEISEEELNSEVELLRDEGLLRRVVEQNGLASPDLRGGSSTGGEVELQVARAVRRLAGHLKAEPIRKTNLILVSYESSDPALSARVLDSLAKLYVEKHKEVRRSSEEFPFFEQQADRSRRRLDDSEVRLLDFSRGRGVVSGALERDLALQRVGEIENTAQQVRIALQETSRRVQVLETRLRSFPERSTSLVRTSDNPQLQGTLHGRLLELELKRTELLTKYEPGYRLVQEVQEQIEQAKAAITAERLAPVREETTEKDPHYEWAKAELDKAQVELSALRAREDGVRSELAIARAQARQLGDAAIQQQDLMRSLKTAEESYLLYAKKSEEARIGDALDERGIVNVIISEPPLTPVLPKRSAWLVMLIGVVAAGTASTLMAFSVDYLDPAFRTPEEVAECLGAPVLASLPREAA